MDLIYTDRQHFDVGVLHDYTFDLAFGSDENDFELTIDKGNHCCETGSLLYIEGTEYGGVVDGLKVVTKNDELTYKGRTWHGILASKVLKPDNGQDYLILAGEANAVIDSLIKRMGLSNLFIASSVDSGLEISGYSMNRYIDAYTGIKKMLETVSGKLKFSVSSNGTVILSAVPAVDYTADEQFDSDLVEMEIETTCNAVNHLICLGKGELAQRQVVHLYTDKNGKISTKQTFKGLEEVEAVYDYPNAESIEELTNSGKEKLAKYAVSNSVKMDFPAEENIYDIGDIVGSRENVTGITASERITKKVERKIFYYYLWRYVLSRQRRRMRRLSSRSRLPAIPTLPMQPRLLSRRL